MRAASQRGRRRLLSTYMINIGFLGIGILVGGYILQIWVLGPLRLRNLHVYMCAYIFYIHMSVCIADVDTDVDTGWQFRLQGSLFCLDQH